MTPCQLCGAKSWGPVENWVDTAADWAGQRFLIGKDLSQYRRCDGCGAFAALAHLTPEPPPRIDPVEASLWSPAAIAGPALTAVQALLSKPETRLERLMRAALSAPISRRPQDLVNYVLECEDLLIAAEAGDRVRAGQGDGEDHDVVTAAKGHGGLYNPHGVGGGPWLVLSWQDQDAWRVWLNGLFIAIWGDVMPTTYFPDWFDRAVAYIAGSRPS